MTEPAKIKPAKPDAAKGRLRFITCVSGNMLPFIAKAGDACLVIPTTFLGASGDVIARHGFASYWRLITDTRCPPDLTALVARNLKRKQIRIGGLFKTSWFQKLYVGLNSIPAKILAQSFDDYLQDNPALTALVFNGFLTPNSILERAAKNLGHPALYLEGGFFPGTVQCDPQGINYDSGLPRDPIFYRTVDLSGAELPTALQKRTPKRTQKLRDTSQVTLPEHYIFVPFQVPSDMQILKLSPWIADMVDFYGVLDRLSHRHPELCFVIKEHPSFPLSVQGRVRANTKILFANTVDTEYLSQHADAVITINSTVGLEAVLLEKKVITLGLAHYALEGLTLQANSEEELHQRVTQLPGWVPDATLRDQFLRYVNSIFLLKGEIGNPDNSLIESMAARGNKNDRYTHSIQQ